MSHTKSDADVLKHYTSFEVPPDDFDPRTASAIQLRRYGLPACPDLKKHPHLHAAWHAAFTRPIQIVQAELAVAPLRARPNQPVNPHPTPRSIPIGSNNWSGVILKANSIGSHDPFLSVMGQWVVPHFTPASTDSSVWDVAFWVGLDGTNQTPLLQAGVSAYPENGQTKYRAFTEWTPLGAVYVMNVPVKAGDVLEVHVCALKPDQGSASFINVTTGVSTVVQISPPLNVTSHGATAEWVVERASGNLAHFSDAVCKLINATTTNHTFDLSQSGSYDVFDIVTQGRTTTDHTPQSITVKWYPF